MIDRPLACALARRLGVQPNQLVMLGGVHGQTS